MNSLPNFSPDYFYINNDYVYIYTIIFYYFVHIISSFITCIKLHIFQSIYSMEIGHIIIDAIINIILLGKVAFSMNFYWAKSYVSNTYVFSIYENPFFRCKLIHFFINWTYNVKKGPLIINVIIFKKIIICQFVW